MEFGMQVRANTNLCSIDLRVPSDSTRWRRKVSFHLNNSTYTLSTMQVNEALGLHFGGHESHGTKVDKDEFWEKHSIHDSSRSRPRLSSYIYDTRLRFAHIILANSIFPTGEFNEEVNDRDVLFLAQMKGLHKMWKPNLGFFILRHLKELL